MSFPSNTKKVFRHRRLRVELLQRVDVLVMRGCTLAPQQSRLGKDEGTGIQRAQGRASARPSEQGTVERRAAIGLWRPAR